MTWPLSKEPSSTCPECGSGSFSFQNHPVPIPDNLSWCYPYPDCKLTTSHDHYTCFPHEHKWVQERT